MDVFGSTTSAVAVIGSVASSTSTAVVSFAPIFEFMAGFILAIALVSWVVSIFAHRGAGQNLTVDDTIM